jgi:anti-anti-sigma factor
MGPASLLTRTEPGADGRTIITAEGDIDLTTAGILREALEHALQTPATVVVDVGGVGFIDSSGLNAFVWGHRHAQSSGCSLLLRHPSAMLRRLLEVTALDSILRIDGEVPPDGSET